MNITWNIELKRDMLIVFYIITLPFAFYFYKVVPEHSSFWEFSWFFIDSGYFEYIDYYFWCLFNKYLTLGILSVWFISCRHTWKGVLLFPILFEIYKFFSIINFASNGKRICTSLSEIFKDQLFWISIFVLIPYLFLLVLLSIKMKYYSLNRSFNQIINSEINQQLNTLSKFNVQDYEIIKEKFLNLTDQKNKIERKYYLIKLIALRDEIKV